MGRKKAREQAFKLLYELEIQKEDIKEQIELFIENNDISDENTSNYIKNIVNGTVENKEELILIISKYLKNWNFERISKIDVALLKLAIYEIKFTDVPFKVAINEVIELSKSYSDDASPSFINGVLAGYIKDSKI